jgi:uncharacterized membrane protein YgdD (TMEM256/DUF423 family)
MRQPRPAVSAERLLLALGAGNGFVAVALGAFGAHGLRGKIAPDLLEVYQTGAHYHLIHAVALLVVAALVGRWEGVADDSPSTAVAHARRAGWLFASGILIFSGSLYLLALTGTRWLGAITPLGGVCFLSGWISLLLASSARPWKQ